MPKSGGLSDVLTISVNAQSTGTYFIGKNCVSASSGCTALVFVIDFNANTGAVSGACSLSAGVVNVSRYSETSAAGEFSDTGGCVGASGVPTDFSISNGVFAIPALKGGSTTTSMK